jgi:methyl-accepting chemotaxis protein
MRFSGRLLTSVVAVAAGMPVVSCYLSEAVLPLAEGQRGIVRATAVVAALLGAALVGGVLAVVTRPLRRADRAQRAGALDAGAVAAAADAAHRLPARTASLAGLASAAGGAALVWAMARTGLAEDLATAAAAVSLAAAILAAMLAYSLAAAAGAQAVEALGARVDVAGRGTVRGKIMMVGFGLDTIAILLLASTGYVRYRADLDREYVAAAARAQESALAMSGSRVAPDLARHLSLATGAPSAVLGPGGAIVARFGAGDVPFDRALAAAPGAVRLHDGWLVTARGPGGGVVASWLPEEALRGRREQLWGALGSVALVVYAATALLAWVAARALAVPFRTLARAADRIASGDLTASPPSMSHDELGRLAADFRRMASGLQTLVLDVQGASDGVSAGAREAAAIGERVRAGAQDEHAGVVAAQGAVEAMAGSVLLVSRGVGGLSDHVAATHRAMAELATAFERLSGLGGELERGMDGALGDVARLAAAGSDAEARLGHLEALAGHAGGTLSSVKASLATLEHAAAESETTAAHVAELTEHAGGVAEETVHGIEGLRAAVADAHRRVSALGRRSDDIDQVVDFIAEVAGRTNLLSLNASIIAAQAGEHGKPFGVVADQIRELAAQIARSTKSIGDIVHSVREDVEGTAALIDRGDALAAEGVQLARNSLEALSRIQRSTVHARDTATAVRMAVDAHAQSSGEVSRLVESVADGSRALTGAVQQVGRSVAAVSSVARSVRTLADQVARALEQQSGPAKRQLEGLGRLERMIGEIARAVEHHDAATRRVRDTLRSLSEAAGAHDGAVEGLSAVADRLGARARALSERAGRFKV